MTVVKINGRPAASASDAVERFADQLYGNNRARIMVIAELKHAGRTEPAPDEDKDRSVELKISGLEVASPEQAEDLRKAMRALYLGRTAEGTLDPDGELEASKNTLRLLEGSLVDLQYVRLRVGLRHWLDRTRDVFRTPNLSNDELRLELDRIADGLAQVLDPGLDSHDGPGEFLRHGTGLHLGRTDDEEEKDQ